ncbi:MAG: hypothetical protein KAR56_01055 [Thermoplasmata archaeon]|nr:hypothetical protein [Thermoplasmata archaeon]
MASKKDKDAESGLQVFAILGIFCTIGFYYWTWDGALSDFGMSQRALSCCNVVNILLTMIFLASWRYTKKEIRIKDYLEEYFVKNVSISIEHITEKFRISQSSAIKILNIWAMETAVKGEYDVMTGIYSKEPEPEDDILPFCPKCGSELEIIGARNCSNCKDFE